MSKAWDLDPFDYDPNDHIIKRDARPVRYVPAGSVTLAAPPLPLPSLPDDLIKRAERAEEQFQTFTAADGGQTCINYAPARPGYHLSHIKKGVLGEISKIEEELEELKDAHEQGCAVMELVELADLVGAIKQYIYRHHVGRSIADLEKMADITARAFRNGRR